MYGQTVDAVDAAPVATSPPGVLPERPASAQEFTVSGKYGNWFPGALGGKYELFYRGDNITLTGKGYITVRYEIAAFNRTGQMVMPTWTGLDGKLFHVASGGRRRMDDTVPGVTDLPHTWMGRGATGFITLPSGAMQMWQNEFFYLDGTVTLHNNEVGADYNMSVTPIAYSGVVRDINLGVDLRPNIGGVRYGLVRDTGDDAAPVPQYLTRSSPVDQSTVAQRSTVRLS